MTSPRAGVPIKFEWHSKMHYIKNCLQKMNGKIKNKKNINYDEQF